jgi:hypothetical protein
MKSRRPVSVWRVLAGVVLLGVIVCAAALAYIGPAVFLTDAVNRRLATIPHYKAHVARADIRFRPLGVVIDGLSFGKDEVAAPAAFVTIHRLQIFIVPSALRHKFFLIDHVSLDGADSLFLMRQRKPGQPPKFGLWQKFFEGLPAFWVRRVSVRNGSIRIRNDEDIPATDIYFSRVNVHGSNMANRRWLVKGGSKARLEGTGRMMDHAPLWMSVEAEPFASSATFRLKGRLRDFRLVTLNPVLRHYTDMDLNNGLLDIDGDIAVGGGVYVGDVRRSQAGVKVFKKGEKHGGLGIFMKEFFVQAWLNRQAGKDGKIDETYILTGPLGYLNHDVFLAGAWTAKTAFLQSMRPRMPEKVEMGPPEQAEAEWMELQAKEREKLLSKKSR